jgi:peptide-methionine (R)-S-oxide reductase
MNRRLFVQGLAVVTSFAALKDRSAFAQSADSKAVEEMRRNWKQLLAEGTPEVTIAPPLKLSAAEWKKRLSTAAFNVLREEGTERAGTSELNAEKRAGVFVCAGCALPVFTSSMKYESGTGWPSFFTTIPNVFAKKTDYKLLLPRTEYHCAKCGGHHGHVFEDGPAPTRERWCNNGVALRFIPKVKT